MQNASVAMGDHASKNILYRRQRKCTLDPTETDAQQFAINKYQLYNRKAAKLQQILTQELLETNYKPNGTTGLYSSRNDRKFALPGREGAVRKRRGFVWDQSIERVLEYDKSTL